MANGSNKAKRTYVGPHAAVTVVLAVEGGEDRVAYVRKGESLTDLTVEQSAALDAQEGLWKDPSANKEGDA